MTISKVIPSEPNHREFPKSLVVGGLVTGLAYKASEMTPDLGQLATNAFTFMTQTAPVALFRTATTHYKPIALGTIAALWVMSSGKKDPIISGSESKELTTNEKVKKYAKYIPAVAASYALNVALTTAVNEIESKALFGITMTAGLGLFAFACGKKLNHLINGNEGLGPILSNKDIAKLEEESKAGNIEATVKLGRFYFNWRSDYAKALEYFQKGASQGDPSALYNLGLCYENGAGVAYDSSTAVKFYQRAAEKGFILAMESLVRYFSFRKDDSQAEHWRAKIIEARTKKA